jgi:polysaccharide deacetylase 2 family uncharacterized protein YibQ
MSRDPLEGRKRRKRVRWIVLIAGAFASGLLLIGLAQFWPAGDSPVPRKGSPFAEPESRVPAGVEDGAGDLERREPLLAIVVGDLGYDPVRDAEWLGFPAKITLSVLPFGPSSRNVASSAQSRGHCVILHVPMEPRSPSPDATEPFRLRVGMEREEIAERLARMAQDVPQAVGAMNHMGSAFTTDPDSMEAFAAELKKMGYFFVDGATAPDSLGMEAAGKAGVTAVQRDVFFDDDPAPEALRRQWGKAVALAKKNGWAVLVCHSRRETYSALAELVPSLRTEGVRPVTVPELLAGSALAGGPAGRE